MGRFLKFSLIRKSKRGLQEEIDPCLISDLHSDDSNEPYIQKSALDKQVENPVNQTDNNKLSDAPPCQPTRQESLQSCHVSLGSGQESHRSCSTGSLHGCTTAQRSILKKVDYQIPIMDKGWHQVDRIGLNRRKLTVTNISTIIVDTKENQSSDAACQTRTVQFGPVSMRTYGQILGDNPSVSYGPPIQLDWDYDQWDPIPLSVFEDVRKKYRRPVRHLPMSCLQRTDLLLRQGFSEEEILKKEREIKKLKHQRARTQATVSVRKVEEFFGGAKMTSKRLSRSRNRGSTSTAEEHDS